MSVHWQRNLQGNRLEVDMPSGMKLRLSPTPLQGASSSDLVRFVLLSLSDSVLGVCSSRSSRIVRCWYRSCLGSLAKHSSYLLSKSVEMYSSFCHRQQNPPMLSSGCKGPLSDHLKTRLVFSKFEQNEIEQLNNFENLNIIILPIFMIIVKDLLIAEADWWSILKSRMFV